MRWFVYLNLLCFVYHVSCEDFSEGNEFQIVEVILSQTVTLQCNVFAATETDKITLVIWYRNNNSLPIYSVDMRERHRPEYADHWSDEKIIGSRAYYDIDKRSLVIEHVTQTDEGFYRCRMDFKQSPTKSYDIKLIVVVPVQNVTILEAIQSYELENYSFELPAITEGSSLTATCVAVGGNPKPKLIWWRNNQVVDQTYELYENIVKNILWLDRVLRKNAYDILTCKAENSKLIEPKKMAVSINIYLAPQEITFVGENKAMSAGHQYEIACRAKGSKPPANITWRMDKMLIREPLRYSVTKDRRSVISVLTYTPEEADSGKILSCEAFNVYVPHEKRKDSWTLKVNYAPVVNLTLGSNLNASSIREGVDVYFECIVRADPWITKVKWLHDDSGKF